MGKTMTRGVMKIKIRGVVPNDTYQRRADAKTNEPKSTVVMMMTMMMMLLSVVVMGIVSYEILILVYKRTYI